MALPIANRLKHRRDFQEVYQKGLRRQGRCLILRALPDFSPFGNSQSTEAVGKAQPTRIGISISQKVSKKAVVRNRFKRQIRSAFQELFPSIAPGWRLVVVVRPGVQECEYEDFLRELKQLLAQAEVLNGNTRESLL